MQKYKNVNIPDTVSKVAGWIFYGCDLLETVVIGDGVTSIGDSAFDMCKALKTVTVPASVTYISSSAFWNIPKTVIICGYADSTAQNYAGMYYFPFEMLHEPANLSATAGDKEITLSWDSVKDIKCYEIIRDNDGTYQTIATISSKTEVTVKSLANNFEYTFLIKVIKNNGAYSISEPIKATPRAALAKPVVTATAGDKSAKLSWTAVEGASYYQIIRYKNGQYTFVANIKGTSATVMSLTNNYKYAFLVCAVGADGTKQLSTAVWVTPVKSMEKPVVTATAGNKQAILRWNAVEGASYYQIIRYNKGVYSVVANVKGTSATVMGLANNFKYTYLVKAVASDGKSTLSAAVYVTPMAMEKPVVTATAGDKQATLCWDAVEGADYYQIIRYNKGNYTVVANVKSTSATVMGLTNNFEYTYLVKAVSYDGTSALSAAVKVTPKA